MCTIIIVHTVINHKKGTRWPSPTSSAFRFLGAAATGGMCSTKAAPVWALKQTLFTWDDQKTDGLLGLHGYSRFLGSTDVYGQYIS